MLKLLGFNYKTAPTHVREQIALLEKTAFYDMADELGLAEFVVLSTCNRIEFVTITTDLTPLKQWLDTNLSIESNEYYYDYETNDAIKHLLRVACGLDSMVLGEPQILGQMKQAFTQAGQSQRIRKNLGHLFPFIFSVAKKVRFHTEIGVNSISVASTAVELVKKKFDDLSAVKILLIGAGDTIQLVGKHLHSAQAGQLLIANRTLEKGQALASTLNASAIRIGDIPDTLPEIDIVIASTASQLPIIGKGLMERVMKHRQHHPLLMIDLAMPRDIEPEVASIENIELHNIDDLQTVIQKNLKHRESAAEIAEKMITDAVVEFEQWQHSLKSVPVICTYRQTMETIRDIELEKALKNLTNGKNAEQIIQRLAHDLTQKLIHSPTIELRELPLTEKKS